MCSHVCPYAGTCVRACVYMHTYVYVHVCVWYTPVLHIRAVAIKFGVVRLVVHV